MKLKVNGKDVLIWKSELYIKMTDILKKIKNLEIIIKNETN